jgi:uncharacterized protein
MKTALIVYGGWDGHQPKEVSQLLDGELRRAGFSTEVSDTLDALLDGDKLKKLDLIVPIWTMGTIKREQLTPLLEAVKSGVGIAGCHGGMCDSFRNETEYQFMTGGQWVAHPGNDGTRHRVSITGVKHAITEGISDFDVSSEQYYMHVDPACRVLATTRFPVADGPHVGNGPVDMPVVWTKMYGSGKVFYNSLGHHADIMESEPCLTIQRRGFLWAAK